MFVGEYVYVRLHLSKYMYVYKKRETTVEHNFLAKFVLYFSAIWNDFNSQRQLLYLVLLN